MNEISCCFAGHRRIPQEKLNSLRQRVFEEIDRAYEKGYRRFLCGGELGFDTLCAEAMIEKKKEHPDALLILVIPFLGQKDCLGAEDKAIYERIYAECDECYCMSETYLEGCLQMRNRAMVDDSSLLIAYLDHVKSASAYTLKHAKDNGLVVVNLADNASEIDLSVELTEQGEEK